MGNKEEKLQPRMRFRGFTDAWEKRELGEIAKVQGGGTPSSSNSEYWDGGINWFTPTEVSNSGYLSESNRKISELGLAKSSAKVLPVGTVLMTSRAGVGDMGILTQEAATNQGFQSLIPDEGVPSYFLYSMQQSISRQANRLASGSTFTEISGKQVAKIPEWIPTSHEERRKVGDFFANLDNLIAVNQRKLDLLKEQKKGYLQKIFPKNGEKVPELRFAGFADDWEQRKLGDVAEFINGRAYKQKELLDSGKYPVLRVGNFNTNDRWYYSDLELPAKNYADKGDLLYTWATAFGPHIWPGPKVIYHYHIWKVELSDQLTKSFTMQLLQADQAQMTNSLNGSTMVHITKGTMESKVIALPSVAEQTKISKFLEDLDSTIALHQRKLDLLKEQKKGYLQKMFAK